MQDSPSSDNTTNQLERPDAQKVRTKKQRVGVTLFWIAVAWAIGWGVVGGVFMVSAFNSMTNAELSKSIWSDTGLFYLNWSLAVPLAAIVAGIGIMLKSDLRKSEIWKAVIIWVVGLLLIVATFFMEGCNAPMFGIGGTLILLFALGTFWFWAKERTATKKSPAEASVYKLIGYVFMLMAAWFTCGVAGQPFMKALQGVPVESPMDVMVSLVLGWFFLFLGYYRSSSKSTE